MEIIAFENKLQATGKNSEWQMLAESAACQRFIAAMKEKKS